MFQISRNLLRRTPYKEADQQHINHDWQNIHGPRENGLREASIRDFHSFRVTWVTLALTSNVPMELVRKVTGHRTVEIVLKHYFQPGRDDFRNALESKMPNLLSLNESGTTSKCEATEMLKAIREEISTINESTWKAARNRLLKKTERLSKLLQA